MLFKKLTDKGMCPLFVRLLLHMYTHQKLQVRWNDVISNQFSVKNGVRQGGVISPLLFGVYMDGLLEELKHLVLAVILGNISAELQDMQITLYYYVLLVLDCEKILRCVRNMPNHIMCCLMGQKANYWCTTRRMLIRIVK